ncbi:MAG: two pore domain potassium channel family protein [Burkholderiaceae bacterium]
MYESKNEPLMPARHFTFRLFKHLGLATTIVCITLAVGVTGHLWLEPIHWQDAFLNISLILAGIGPFIMPSTAAGKMFFALYSILVGLVFVATLGLVLAPLAHRLIHKFHLDRDND